MKRIVIILGLTIMIALFWRYGRSIYIPMIQKIKGKETVASIESNISHAVQERLKPYLKQVGITTEFPGEIILVAFKEERELHVYVHTQTGFQLLKTYPFTAFSGKIGPKLQEGDKQIPEGIYEVEYLNPNSAYYLSIKVSYPNSFDISKTQLERVEDMGGDIFIHGKAVTVGCIPIGDQAMEEVFMLVHKVTKKPVKVIISPRDFRVNPIYPTIDEITWENELYQNIHSALKAL